MIKPWPHKDSKRWPALSNWWLSPRGHVACHPIQNSIILEILKFLNCSYFAKIVTRKPKIGKFTNMTELYPFLGFCGDVTSHENQEYFSRWLQWCFTFLVICPFIFAIRFWSGLVELWLRSMVRLLCSHILSPSDAQTPVDLFSCIFSPLVVWRDTSNQLETRDYEEETVLGHRTKGGWLENVTIRD